MSKKILTVLAPVTALIAFAMVPAMAQATSLQAPAGTPLGVGGAVQAQSANLVTTSTTGGKLECAESTFHGKVAATGGADVSVQIESASFAPQECKTNNGAVTAHIFTNLQGGGIAPATHWTLQVQQPEDPNMAQVTAHILPEAGSTIQFGSQLQVGGSSIATCYYSAPSVQLMGSTSSHVYTIEGANQFTLEQTSAGAACGTPHTTTATLTGEVQFESGANKVFVDMT